MPDKTTPAKFARETVRILRGIRAPGSARNLFLRVGRSAEVSPERIAKIPAFPAAIVMQLGGELDDANGEIWSRQLGVAVLIQTAFDAFMDDASDKLDQYTSLVVDELQSTRRGNAIQCIQETEEQVVAIDDQTDILMKVSVFDYEIDREVSDG